MSIDIAKLEAKIKKLQQIKELAQDPEMNELLSDLVVTPNGNGNRHVAAKNGHKASVGEAVEKACLETTTTFTVKGIMETLLGRGYHFAAKEPEIAVYNALARLKDKGVVQVVESGGPGKPAYWSLTEAQKRIKMKLDT